MTLGREAVPSRAHGHEGRGDSVGEGCIIEIHIFSYLLTAEQVRALRQHSSS